MGSVFVNGVEQERSGQSDRPPERRRRTEWVAVLHGQNGTIKIAYRNPAALAEGLKGQTAEGWMVASVYEREAQVTPDE